MGQGLGMHVIVSDPYQTVTAPGIRQVALDALLAESDFVVCLAVATEETENLMNAARFAQMKPSAFFINLSRGNLVDEAALARAPHERPPDEPPTPLRAPPHPRAHPRASRPPP